MRNSGWRQTWMLDQGYFSSKVWAIQVLCNLLSTHTLQLIQQVISTQCNQFVVSIFKSPRRTGFHNSYVSLMVLGISGKFIRSNAIFLCAIGARNFRVNQITLAIYVGFYGGVNVLYGNKSTFTMISQFYIMLIIRSRMSLVQSKPRQHTKNIVEYSYRNSKSNHWSKCQNCCHRGTAGNFQETRTFFSVAVQF